MKQKIVVTNLRIPEEDWLQVKTISAAMGMSTNEYLNTLIQETTIRKQLGLTAKKKKTKKSNEKRFWAIYKIMEKAPYIPMGATDEDKAIYGIEDD